MMMQALASSHRITAHHASSQPRQRRAARVAAVRCSAQGEDAELGRRASGFVGAGLAFTLLSASPAFAKPSDYGVYFVGEKRCNNYH